LTIPNPDSREEITAAGARLPVPLRPPIIQNELTSRTRRSDPLTYDNSFPGFQ